MDRKYIWKLVGWTVMAAGLFILILLPLKSQPFTFLDDDGLAFAQTIPPGPPDEPGPPFEPPGPPFPPPGPPPCSPGCDYPLPPDMPQVEVEYLSTPPPYVPPLTGPGVIVRVPAALPTGPITGIPVPSGLIEVPVGLIPFDFGPLAFRELGTLVVPTRPDRDLIVRLEILPAEALPIPLDTPGVIPPDWYADPYLRPGETLPQFELGYGAPTPILHPGVTENNYVRYATATGLPTSPVPPPDAATAGVIETQPYTGAPVNLEAIFTLNVYDAETGEEITIHLPELILVRCFNRIFEPNTPVLLRSDELLARYDLPVQAHDRVASAALPDRITAYLLDTSTTFVVATLSGAVRPPLPPGEPELPLNPAAMIPPDLPQECGCRLSLPPGLPLVNVEYPAVPPSGIPPLTGEGVIARVPAAPSIPSSMVTGLPVPDGVIDEPIGLIPLDFRDLYRVLCTLIVPADPSRDLIVRIEQLAPEDLPIPLDAPDVIPQDWYAVPHQQLAELGYGGPTPILHAGVIESNYQRYAAKVGLPTTPIPAPDAATAGVLATQPLAGQPIKVEAVFQIDLYYADTGEEITIHLPELILGNLCFEEFLSPYTPVLLRANQETGRYDIPVQRHTRLVTNAVRETMTAYLLETSTFVIASFSGEIRPPLLPGQSISSERPPSVIPSGLPNTGHE